MGQAKESYQENAYNQYSQYAYEDSEASSATGVKIADNTRGE